MVCPSWLSFILYNPIRKACTDRERILDESGITGDSVVLEVGAGNGFLTEALAQRARKVYAVELQEKMIRKLHRRVRQYGERVSIIHGDIASLVLREAADVCLLYYSFHEVDRKREAADVISMAVRAGGVLSIYEPTIEVGKLQMQETAKLFEQRGFAAEAVRNGFLTRFARLRKTG